MYSAPERVFVLREHRVKNLKHSFQTLCAGMTRWFYLHYNIAVVARRGFFVIACSSLRERHFAEMENIPAPRMQFGAG